MKLFFITWCASMVMATTVYATTLSIEVSPQPMRRGAPLTVDVLVDPGAEDINSVDISLSYPKDILKFKGYIKEKSALQVWLISPQEENGVIHFVGVIPGGLDRLYDPMHVQDHRVTLARLLFDIEDVGVGELTIKDATVLRNDGYGTSIPITTSTIPIHVIQGDTTASPSDTIPPQPFTISIVPPFPLSKTPRLAVFVAEDKESGIHHVDARIGRGGWYRVTSPYPVPYRLFPYTLTMRAFDFSGNYREERIVIPGQDPKSIIIGVLLLLIIVWFTYRMRKSP